MVRSPRQIQCVRDRILCPHHHQRHVVRHRSRVHGKGGGGGVARLFQIHRVFLHSHVHPGTGDPIHLGPLQLLPRRVPNLERVGPHDRPGLPSGGVSALHKHRRRSEPHLRARLADGTDNPYLQGRAPHEVFQSPPHLSLQRPAHVEVTLLDAAFAADPALPVWRSVHAGYHGGHCRRGGGGGRLILLLRFVSEVNLHPLQNHMQWCQLAGGRSPPEPAGQHLGGALHCVHRLHLLCGSECCDGGLLSDSDREREQRRGRCCPCSALNETGVQEAAREVVQEHGREQLRKHHPGRI
mmetsp:Transcript_11686/g.26651  ORF Transcript_11686/g.26651 Transcript_11686/m.26651 type:complete len:296 (+) Transcript_11686:784-1671(+)